MWQSTTATFDPEEHQVNQVTHFDPGPLASPEHWDTAQGRAMRTYEQAKLRVEQTSTGTLASAVLHAYPTAKELSLGHSDQGDYYTVEEVLGDDRETIADWDDSFDTDYA